MTCRQCDEKGVFKVAYRDGTPFDLALCTCRMGLRLRGRHLESSRRLLAITFHVHVDRIHPMEDLLDAEDQPSGKASVPIAGGMQLDVTEAGRSRQKRAKL